MLVHVRGNSLVSKCKSNRCKSELLLTFSTAAGSQLADSAALLKQASVMQCAHLAHATLTSVTCMHACNARWHICMYRPCTCVYKLNRQERAHDCTHDIAHVSSTRMQHPMAIAS